ncbi:Signal transduction histidine kinase [Cryptosporangium aurantiacum]|uniref:histidine kinase n=1 Tax=Cryptosporangium aurantiacum TaxID=134849 RepID=A0A1M7IUM5_9ACTN|nr:Signal transduction histidine kinase [Cryptosporangium aurantiacum]
MAVAASVIALLMVRGTPSLLLPHGGAMLAGQLVLALLLLRRRRRPVLVAWVTTAAAAAIAVCEALAPGTLVTPGLLSEHAYPWLPAAAPFAAYAATAFGGRRGLVPAAVLVAVATHAWALPPDSPWFIQGLVFAGGPALLGLYTGARRRLLESLTERTERAERERYLLAEQARAEERSRLAAEMHDLVTHRVSLMVLQAGALRVTASDEPTRLAADEIRATGCQALAELRDAIGLLKAPPAVLVEAPAGNLAALVDESGLNVELVEDGDAGVLSPVVGRTVYRVVQEALTNVRKHAPSADVSVWVRYEADGVRVSVRNGPPEEPPDPTLAASGSGTGLLGLAQRVELLDGSLDAGPDRGGGFRVEAQLPAYVPTRVSGVSGVSGVAGVSGAGGEAATGGEAA